MKIVRGTISQIYEDTIVYDGKNGVCSSITSQNQGTTCQVSYVSVFFTHSYAATVNNDKNWNLQGINFIISVKW